MVKCNNQSPNYRKLKKAIIVIPDNNPPTEIVFIGSLSFPAL